MNSTISAVKKNLDLTQNKPLKVLMYEAFRKTIVLGDIPAGERINEKEFSDALNISRTPIRIAMKALVNDQLVDHIPKIGIIVKGISKKDAREIYKIRKSLDTLATIEAMKVMTNSDFSELRSIVELGEKFSQENNIEALLLNFFEFNRFIYIKSQMPRLLSIINELENYLVYFRKISVQSPDRRNQVIEENLNILKEMHCQQTDKLTMSINEHLDHSLQFILKEMEKRNSD